MLYWTLFYAKTYPALKFLANQNLIFMWTVLHIQGSFWNRELTWKLPITTSDFTLLHRVRQKEAEEEERSREYMEDRMQAILSLKGNIETNKVW